MAEKINKSYVLPRDWWSVKSFLGLLYPLVFVGLYKLFSIIISDISSGVKYTLQEIWSSFISMVFGLGVSVLLLWLVYRSFKKTTIQFTSEELLVDNKNKIKWDDLVGYKRDENSVTLLDYKDKPYRFYTGNLTYYVNEDLKKMIKELPERSKK
jgi:energy-coupling factor transporter transmembrane protein EcfT